MSTPCQGCDGGQSLGHPGRCYPSPHRFDDVFAKGIAQGRAEALAEVAALVTHLGGKAVAEAIATAEDGTWRVIASVLGDIADAIEKVRAGRAKVAP